MWHKKKGICCFEWSQTKSQFLFSHPVFWACYAVVCLAIFAYAVSQLPQKALPPSFKLYSSNTYTGSQQCNSDVPQYPPNYLQTLVTHYTITYSLFFSLSSLKFLDQDLPDFELPKTQCQGNEWEQTKEKVKDKGGRLTLIWEQNLPWQPGTVNLLL